MFSKKIGVKMSKAKEILDLIEIKDPKNASRQANNIQGHINKMGKMIKNLKHYVGDDSYTKPMEDAINTLEDELTMLMVELEDN